MPDPILDSLCTEGIARRRIITLPSSTPEYPYKSLGTRQGTMFFRKANQYTIELLIQGGSVVQIKSESRSENTSQNILARLYQWAINMRKHGTVQFMKGGRGTGGGGGSYRSDIHLEALDVTPFFNLFGAFRFGSHHTFIDYLSALFNIKDGIEMISDNTKKTPDIPGRGALRPEEYQVKVEEALKKEKEKAALEKPPYKRPEPEVVPSQPTKDQGNKPSFSGNSDIQKATIVITEVPTDTIRLGNRDSINTIDFVGSLRKIRERDTIIGEKKWGEQRQLEMLRRQDTVYYINIILTPTGIIYKDHITGESISKQKYEEIKRSE